MLRWLLFAFVIFSFISINRAFELLENPKPADLGTQVIVPPPSGAEGTTATGGGSREEISTATITSSATSSQNESLWLYPEKQQNVSNNFDDFLIDTNAQTARNLVSSFFDYVFTAFRGTLVKMQLVPEGN